MENVVLHMDKTCFNSTLDEASVGGWELTFFWGNICVSHYQFVEYIPHEVFKVSLQYKTMA